MRLSILRCSGPVRRLRRLGALWLIALLLQGCASVTSLARRIESPPASPLRLLATRDAVDVHLGLHAQTLRMPEGFALAYEIVEPADYGFQFTLRRRVNSIAFDANFHAPDQRTPAKGTIVYLHGWSLDGASMLPWALALAERGYRGVLADLRNHGRSGRAPAGYGPREADDVAVLIRTLRERGEIDGPLFLFGVSYGAATALFAASALGGEVDAVLAMASYANAGEGIRSLIAGRLDDRDGNLGRRIGRAWLRRRYDAPTVDAAVARAGAHLGLNLDAIEVDRALTTIPACVLLVHGDRDSLIPIAAARRLIAANPSAQLVVLPATAHTTAPLRVDWLADPLVRWLAARQHAGACTAFTLPADELADGGSHALRSPSAAAPSRAGGDVAQ